MLRKITLGDFTYCQIGTRCMQVFFEARICKQYDDKCKQFVFILNIAIVTNRQPGHSVIYARHHICDPTWGMGRPVLVSYYPFL